MDGLRTERHRVQDIELAMAALTTNQGLADLPNEILLLVLANLESARDMRSVALACRRLHQLVRDEGWRVFVKTGFSSMSVPESRKGQHNWRQLAESLTWQSRCWDRRALQFQSFVPVSAPRQHASRRALFQPVLDASFDPDTQEELVVWGAGETVVARYRERRAWGRPAKIAWLRSEGKDFGLVAGHDDVRAIAIARHYGAHPGGRAILTGRDNGELALLSAEPGRFGERLAKFSPAFSSEEAISGTRPEESTDQDTVNSLDVTYSGSGSLVAAATRSTVLVYKLPEDGSTQVAPSATYDLAKEAFNSSSTQLCRAVWMGQGDVLALALKGDKENLRYMTITPSGWTYLSTAKNPEVEKQFSTRNSNICPNSLQPVHPQAWNKGGTSLLLSAWRDGTCRLQDIRTSSPFDAVYQDNIDPWADMEALMVYGTERFVGGGMNGATVKVFDFRWTKGYYHSSGLPCLDRAPFSPPPQPFLQPPDIGSSTHGPGTCNYLRGELCHWHTLSRHLYYRPNATFFLSSSLARRNGPTSVWSLAKASDVAPNFFIGISGGILEANLEPSRDKMATMRSSTISDPNFGFGDWRRTGAEQGGYVAKPLDMAVMETGDGAAVWGNDRPIRLPRMLTPGFDVPDIIPLASHHRLDPRLHLVRNVERRLLA
ncbi:hypothetical protein B0T24DRAFT_79082 [Lasiosphaeria ovina]|uniref:F-box domain-containing protein n=1 Tax=Lasiosphaeria ovina TaxID=92902 RepID=A0AAE0NMJ2_9PEZI|nr:hypothetical protein B0T24DRAFT_79082 [Lasiosphaeria ovina]